MYAAPVGKILELSRRGQSDVARDVQLDAGRQRESAPERALQRGLLARLRPRISLLPPTRCGECVLDLVERAASLLHRLGAQQLIEMFLAVVIAPAHAERGWQQAFLNVVADGAPRDAGKFGEVADGIAGCVVHEDEYRQLLSHCQLSH